MAGLWPSVGSRDSNNLVDIFQTFWEVKSQCLSACKNWVPGQGYFWIWPSVSKSLKRGIFLYFWWIILKNILWKIDFNISVKEEFSWGINPVKFRTSRVLKLAFYLHTGRGSQNIKIWNQNFNQLGVYRFWHCCQPVGGDSRSCPGGSWTDCWERSFYRDCSKYNRAVRRELVARSATLSLSWGTEEVATGWDRTSYLVLVLLLLCAE